MSLAELLDRFDPVDLATLDEQAALQRRVDNKYLVELDVLGSLLDRLRPTRRALEIDGTRVARYESVYFDTATLRCFHDHVEDRIPRAKFRTRLYRDTAVCAFEVKVKLEGGEMVKESLDYDAGEHGRVTPEAREFVEAQLARRGPDLPAGELAPTLATRYRRATLGADEERVTIDEALSLRLPSGAGALLSENQVLMETKSEAGSSAADDLLREAGCETVSLSKYRAGIGLLLDDAPLPGLQDRFTVSR